jgi:hypothetical protein
MIPRPLIYVSGSDQKLASRFARTLLESVPFLPTHVCAIRTEETSSPRRVAKSGDRRRLRLVERNEVAPHRYEFEAPDTIAFYEAPFMEDFSEWVLIEGDRAVEAFDFEVFVASPPLQGETLLRRTSTGAEREHADMTDVERFLSSLGGSSSLGPVAARRSGFPTRRALQSQRDLERSLREELMKLVGANPSAQSGRASRQKAWTLHERYRGIERAGLVVVHCETDDERSRADAFLDEVARMREDRSVFHDIARLGVRRVPITSVRADLGDAKDAGTKKAIARVARAVRHMRKHSGPS